MARAPWHEIIEEIASETVILFVVLLSIWGIRAALDYMLGSGAKFYGIIPISWVTDTGDLLPF